MNFNLPFNINIASNGKGAGTLNSGLANHLVPNELEASEVRRERMKGFVDGVESLLLALASNGIDLHDTRITSALETAVEGASNELL
jgi:hypothetical protein